MNESTFLRALAGILMFASGIAVGGFFGYAADALNESFPPHRSFGQNMAVLGLILVGLALAALCGTLGISIILRRKR